ncbi:MAG TPA: tRNA pseudouridine(38-40) synthase TruA [Terriglobia bacterium]|nr:tRNA pseudouridine(38-40) synthase TruA [Terriglobia bacterium]
MTTDQGHELRNICLTLTYDGTDFHGWQWQPGLPTIQESVEEALARIIGERADVYGSGRTDAGVHALGQVANFRTSCRIPWQNLVKALNDALPPAVRVKEAREVAEEFHARYDARSKTYRYRILQTPICSPFLWRFVWHYPYPLDHKRMAAAAKLVEGEHDFTSFAACSGVVPLAPGGQIPPLQPDPRPPAPDPRSSVRTIFSSRLLARPQTSMLIYEVRGSGFVHHMVRNIVGTLIEVGRGKLAPSDMLRILEARDRTLAGPTAPASGLCLVRVEY